MKYEKGLLLYENMLISGTKLNFIVKYYNIKEQAKYNINIKSLDKNTCIKPIIERDNENLFITINSNEINSIKFLKTEIELQFNDTFIIPIYIQSYVIPFDFKFEVYDYYNKCFSEETVIYLNETNLPVQNYILHCQLYYPKNDYLYGTVKFGSFPSKFLKIVNNEEIKNKIENNKIIDQKFDIHLSISKDILKINHKKEQDLEKKEYNIFIIVNELMRKITIKLKTPPFFMDNEKYNMDYVRKLGLLRYKDNKFEKVKSIDNNFDRSIFHLSMFGTANILSIIYYLKSINISNASQKLTEFLFIEFIQGIFNDNEYKVGIIKDNSATNGYNPNKCYILGRYNNDPNYWFPVFNDYMEELDKFEEIKLKERKTLSIEDMDKNAKKNLSKIFNLISRDTNNFNNFNLILKIIVNLEKEKKDALKNASLLKFVKKFKEIIPSELFNERFGKLRLMLEDNEKNLSLKIYNFLIITNNVCKNRYEEIAKNGMRIILNAKDFEITQDVIDNKIQELKEQYFKFNENEYLKENYIKKSFPCLTKIERDKILIDNKEKKPEEAFKQKEGHEIFSTIINDEQNYIELNEYDEQIEKEKKDFVPSISSLSKIEFPKEYTINNLRNFYSNSIKIIRELPLYTISSKNNEENLHNPENIYSKLLCIYEKLPEDDNSLLSDMINNFSDAFQKMTNNFQKSGVKFPKNILPNKLKLEKLDKGKEYISYPKKIEYDSIKFTFWKEESNNNEVKGEKRRLDTITSEFTIQDDSLEDSSRNLKLQRLESLKKEINSNNIENENKNNNKINEAKMSEDETKQNEKENKIKNNKFEEILILDTGEDESDEEKENNDQLIEEKKQKFNRNKSAKKAMEINTNVQKEIPKINVNLDKFNFKESIIIKLIIRRMKEIDKISDPSKFPILNQENCPIINCDSPNNSKNNENYQVNKLINNSLIFSRILMKEISQKYIPFSDIAVNILIDCSGFIKIENKLKMLILIFGLTYALNIVNIPYSILLVGDSDFKCELKTFKEPHSIEALQRVFECVFIKRFIQKNYISISHAINKIIHPSSPTHRSFFMFTDGLDEDFLLTDQWNNNIFNNPNNFFTFIFMKPDELFQENQSSNLTYLKEKWKNFEIKAALSQSNVSIIDIDSNYNLNTYNNCAILFCQTLVRNYIYQDNEEIKYYPPSFKIIEPNLKNTLVFEQPLKINFDTIQDIYLKNTDVLKNINKPQTFKLNPLPYKNNLNKITSYDYDEKYKQNLHKFVRYFIENRNRINTSKLETIFKPNKPSQKVLSSTGTEFDITALILYLISPPTLEPMIYLEEKGVLIKNYSVSLIIDNSFSCFNNLCSSNSIQIIRILLSALLASELPCFDLIITTNYNPYILCSDISTNRALNNKSPLWESLLSIINSPCTMTDLGSAIECVYDLNRMRTKQYTKFCFVLTDGLFEQKKQKNIINAVSNCVKYGINVFGIGIGIYPKGIEKLFPHIIYSPNPYNLPKSLSSFFGDSISGICKEMPFLNFDTKGHFEEISGIINELINNEENGIFKELKKKLSSIVTKTDAFKLIANPEKNLSDSDMKLATNPTGEGCELLKKDELKGQKILYVRLYHAEYALTKYLFEPSPDSQSCLNEALSFYGIIIDTADSMLEGIKKLTTLREDGKCQYYAVWTECDNGQNKNYEKQYMDVLLEFWKRGGALVFLSDNMPYTYPINVFLNILEIDGQKMKFKIDGNHPGTKYLRGDLTGTLNENGTFTKKIEQNGHVERLKLDNNLYKLFEGITISYAIEKNNNNYTACGPETIKPFIPFFKDSSGGISSLYYLSDEKGRGDIFLDGGFTKVYWKFSKTDSQFRYFQNIAAWSARAESHLMFDGCEAKDWRPDGFTYKI